MGAERKIVQNAVLRGKRHNNKILNSKMYCREILLSLRRLLFVLGVAVVFTLHYFDRINFPRISAGALSLQFPHAVVLNAVGRRNTQMNAKERKRAQKSAKERKTQVCKRAQKGAKGRKRALPRKNCKQPGFKQPGLGTPKKGAMFFGNGATQRTLWY